MKSPYLSATALLVFGIWPLAGMSAEPDQARPYPVDPLILAQASRVLCVPAVATSPNMTGSSGFPPCPPGTAPSGNSISNALTIEPAQKSAAGGRDVIGLDASSVGGTQGVAGPAGVSRSRNVAEPKGRASGGGGSMGDDR